MVISVRIKSERKGSNPGGYCTVFSPGKGRFTAYIKYCANSRLPPDHPFKAPHQPVYEAVTLMLADKLGLHVPRYYLLDNADDVSFEHHDDVPRGRRISEDMPFYLVSKLVNLRTNFESPDLLEMMAKQKIYRDMLMVGDVSGKKQNFGLVEEPHPHVLYIDLGCSFADAAQNMMSQRNSVASLTRVRNGAPRRTLRKDLRKARKYLSNLGLVTAHDIEYHQDLLSLVDFADSLDEMEIPALRRRKIPLTSILCETEINEIKSLLILNMQKVIRRYKKAGPLECLVEL